MPLGSGGASSHESGRHPQPQSQEKRDEHWRALARSRSGAPWQQVVGHDVTVRTASAATVTSGRAVLPVLHHVKGLHYRTYRLPCVLPPRVPVLSSLTVLPGQYAVLRTPHGASRHPKSGPAPDFLPPPSQRQPVLRCLCPSRPTFWLSTPGPQHRIPISSSAEQQPRRRPCPRSRAPRGTGGPGRLGVPRPKPTSR